MIDAETDDDDLYFTPTSSSNLASLFNTTMHPLSKEKDAPLTYKPPKQPIVNLDQNTKSVKVKYESVVIFKEVHAFQMVNKEYLALGKCGFTLVGNERLNAYQLLLYKTKDLILSSTNPTAALEITIKPNNYISYTDEKKVAWALHFDSQLDLSGFTQTVTTKCHCKLLKQEGEKAKVEDKAAMTLKSEDIFLNCKTTLSDELNLIPQNEYINDNNVKSNKTNIKNTVFDITQDTQIADMPKNIDSDTSDSSEATKKADILNRVAKMGKKLFDKDIEVTDGSDIDEKETKSDTKMKKSKSSKNNITEKYSHPIPTDDFNQKQSQIIVPYQQSSSSVISPMLTEQLNMLMLENKSSASEIKINMMKLQDGVQQVLRIVQKCENPMRDMSSQTDQEDLLDENKQLQLLILQTQESLEKFKTQNEALRTKNEELMTKATDNAYEIASLTEKNAKSNSEIQSLSVKINQQEQELEYLRSRNCSMNVLEDHVLLKRSVLTDCESKIKLQMNLFFQESCDNFAENDQYTGKTIKQRLAQTIIHNTYSILKTIKEVFNN